MIKVYIEDDERMIRNEGRPKQSFKSVVQLHK